MRSQLAISLALLVLGCDKAPTAPGSPPISELASALTRVVIGGKALTLSTSLTRDFMPISPPDGKPLLAVLRVKTEDGSAAPAGVVADTSWVIHGTEIWMSLLEPRPRTGTSPVYEFVARDGPKWGPGVTVDVVVRLRDSAGQVVLLRAAGQAIGATF